MRIAAGVEYCGANFDGWQKQSGHRTVQACIESALSNVANQTIEIKCAGRTDAGVHAIQQVIHFDTSSQRENHAWLLGVNSNLPDDVNLTWILPVDNEFHSRFSAKTRRYKYFILNRPTRTALFKHLVAWEPVNLDENKMSEAAKYLIGEHDFTSYRATACQAKTSVRNINKLNIERDGNLIIFDIEANAFLHHMVRNISGVLITIGKGKESVQWSKEVLEAKDRMIGGVTAPAAGLYLVNVRYDSHFNIPVSESLNPLKINNLRHQ